MSDSYMRIELEQPWAECGGWISGTASWDGPKTPRSVRVTLKYETEGRGNRDRGEVTKNDLHADRQGYQQFKLKVPKNGPVSFDGNLLSVFWEVELRLDLKGRPDPRETIRVEILPMAL